MKSSYCLICHVGGDVKKLTIFSFEQVCEWELCLKRRQHGPGTKQAGRPQSVSVISVWDGSVTDGGGVQNRMCVCGPNCCRLRFTYAWLKCF